MTHDQTGFMEIAKVFVGIIKQTAKDIRLILGPANKRRGKWAMAADTVN